jgi:hypothetical protein
MFLIVGRDKGNPFASVIDCRLDEILVARDDAGHAPAACCTVQTALPADLMELPEMSRIIFQFDNIIIHVAREVQ